MKAVVAREVERFLFRPGLAERARYYGVVFLNQMPLSHKASQGDRPLSLQTPTPSARRLHSWTEPWRSFWTCDCARGDNAYDSAYDASRISRSLL